MTMLLSSRHIKSKVSKWSFRIRTFHNWYTIVFPINRILSKERTLKARNGIRLFVHDISSSEIGMTREVWEKNDYATLPPTGNIIDIGANIGAFSLLAAKKTKAHIFALEPIPVNFRILKKNVELNNFTSRISPYCLALGMKNERRNMVLSKRNMGGHSFFIPGTNTTSVECETLETFLKNNNIEHVDYIKCDCEGGEYEIFLNTPRAVFNRISTITIELHDVQGYSFSDLENHFQKMGYKVDCFV